MSTKRSFGGGSALTLKVNLGGAVWGADLLGGQISIHFGSKIGGALGGADWHSLWK